MNMLYIDPKEKTGNMCKNLFVRRAAQMFHAKKNLQHDPKFVKLVHICLPMHICVKSFTFL